MTNAAEVIDVVNLTNWRAIITTVITMLPPTIAAVAALYHSIKTHRIVNAQRTAMLEKIDRLEVLLSHERAEVAHLTEGGTP